MYRLWWQSQNAVGRGCRKLRTPVLVNLTSLYFNGHYSLQTPEQKIAKEQQICIMDAQLTHLQRFHDGIISVGTGMWRMFSHSCKLFWLHMREQDQSQDLSLARKCIQRKLKEHNFILSFVAKTATATFAIWHPTKNTAG